STSRQNMQRGLDQVKTLTNSMRRYALDEAATDIGKSVAKLSDAADQEFAATLAARPDYADTLSARLFVPALNAADSLVRSAEHSLSERTAKQVDDQSTGIEQTETATLSALALALAIAAIVAAWLTRSISQPILDLRTGMAAVADGDLGYRLRVPPNRS